MGAKTIENGLIDAWDAIRARIVVAIGESQDFCTSICRMLTRTLVNILLPGWSKGGNYRASPKNIPELSPGIFRNGLLCIGAVPSMGARRRRLRASNPMKRRNINARHLGLILRFPMTSIYTTGSN
jgi:hypothetical protein